MFAGISPLATQFEWNSATQILIYNAVVSLSRKTKGLKWDPKDGTVIQSK